MNDKNGNIKTLKRYGDVNLQDNLTYTYNGNKLTNLAGTTNASYSYDANGNMNHDGRKNIGINYNLLNLPYQVTKNDTLKATYTYLADGTKLSAKKDTAIVTDVMYKRSKNGFDYLGSMVYKTESNSGFGLESTSFGGGRINATSNDYEIDYFITDHLGSTRVIVDDNGNIKEQNDYYPFGMRHENSLLMVSSNRWGYNNKEKQTIFAGFNLLDYGNRMYDPELGRWFVQDPLCEKYYWITPYAFCINNPINIIDPDGRKVKFAQGSSWMFTVKFTQAAVYLLANRNAGLLTKVMTSPTTYTIQEGQLRSNFSINTKTITWDPNMGIITNEGHILSPTTVLNHELDHTVQFDENPAQQQIDIRTPDADYTNKEERRVITGSEQTTAKKLGEIQEGEVTRSDHKGVPYTTKGPISTTGINEIEGATVVAPRTNTTSQTENIVEIEDNIRRKLTNN